MLKVPIDQSTIPSFLPAIESNSILFNFSPEGILEPEDENRRN